MNAAEVRSHGIRDMDRRPGFTIFSRRLKAFGHDANDGVNISAERNGLAYNCLITIELPLPQPVAKHNYKWSAALVIVGGDKPAAGSFYAQRFEVPAADLAHLKLDW